jgi:hypothetical protein
MQIARNIPITQIQRDMRFVPFCVFCSHVLSFPLIFSSFATILNRLQKSSPLSPRLGNKWSSELLRIIIVGVFTNFTLSEPGAGDLEGRRKAGVMGVMGASSGCGVLGTLEAGEEV